MKGGVILITDRRWAVLQLLLAPDTGGYSTRRQRYQKGRILYNPVGLALLGAHLALIAEGLTQNTSPVDIPFPVGELECQRYSLLGRSYLIGRS